MANKLEEYKKFVERAKVTQVPDIDKDGEDKKSWGEIPVWRIDLIDDLNRTIDVHAKNEAEARAEALKALEAELPKD